MATHYYSASAPKGDKIHLVRPGFDRGPGARTFAVCPTDVPKARVHVSHGLHPVSWWEARWEADLCSKCRDAARKKHQTEPV